MIWERKPFLDVVTDITSGNKKFQSAEYLSDGKYPIIDQGADIIAGYTNESAVVERTKPVILFGDHTKKIQFVDYDFCLGADGVKVLNTSDSLLPKFLYYYLQTVNLPDVGYSRHYKFLKECNIPLPPLPIQQQIADTLDKADALRRKDQDLLDKYDELAQAVFYEMFGDPVRNEKEWMAKKLSDLSSHISSGSTPLGGQNVYIKEGVLFIRSQNVLMRKFDITDAAFISEDIHNKMKRTWVKANDVLLNITGASIGRVATYKGPDDKANVNQHVCIIRTKTEYLTPDFLMYLLSNNSYQSHIIGKSAGGTRESFTFSQIKNFDVILPPIILQLKFTKIIESIKRQAELSSESIEKSSQFFLSLMNSYFKN